jgi:hypothetical protein
MPWVRLGSARRVERREAAAVAALEEEHRAGDGRLAAEVGRDRPLAAELAAGEAQHADRLPLAEEDQLLVRRERDGVAGRLERRLREGRAGRGIDGEEPHPLRELDDGQQPSARDDRSSEDPERVDAPTFDRDRLERSDVDERRARRVAVRLAPFLRERDALRRKGERGE